ncbi:hypothetical protein [Nonomuraea deserti]|uniref:hypothetical protein n=1 Tax=Nonomuraea deserti TaxID=1848322 RepID=UPI001FE26E18|nr:hypothetical protein [Nonomuraea deserti]
MRAHGFTGRPSGNLDFATAAELPLPLVVEGVLGAFQEAGLHASMIEVTPRTGRLTVEAAGESRPFGLLREALGVGRSPAGWCGC